MWKLTNISHIGWIKYPQKNYPQTKRSKKNVYSLIHYFYLFSVQINLSLVFCRQKGVLKSRLEKFSLSNPDVTNIKILVAGQIGAGKSSFINSVICAFQGEIVCEALADASGSAVSHSFTWRVSIIWLLYSTHSTKKDLRDRKIA